MLSVYIQCDLIIACLALLFPRSCIQLEDRGQMSMACTLKRGQMSNTFLYEGANVHTYQSVEGADVLTHHFSRRGKCPGGHMSYTLHGQVFVLYM